MAIGAYRGGAICLDAAGGVAGGTRPVAVSSARLGQYISELVGKNGGKAWPLSDMRQVASAIPWQTAVIRGLCFPMRCT